MGLSKSRPRVKNKKLKRLGRGTGSTLGKTSGRGHKGAGQRKGKKTPYPGYSGGTLPFMRLIPKRGFNSPRKLVYQIVNLEDIKQRAAKSSEINPEILKKVNLIKDAKKPIKILAKLKGDFSLKALFKADKFSESAVKLIEKAGGKAECLSK
jgi:large subunit ribosomal protein L15